ncbi:MAG: hypothetical protein MUC36_09590 [Planctomycetes bacterium]|jgi:hypothetical protein|nr:hypothetical protein [Planctomycetota bacterium]
MKLAALAVCSLLFLTACGGSGASMTSGGGAGTGTAANVAPSAAPADACCADHAMGAKSATKAPAEACCSDHADAIKAAAKASGEECGGGCCGSCAPEAAAKPAGNQ